MIVFLIGPAGSGKTTLANGLAEWIREKLGFEVALVNLDPAVEYLPYAPDFDVREMADARKLMKTEKLGPNGALLKAIQILADNVNALVERIASFKKDYIIVDTPGQLDMFAFHNFGEKIVSELQRRGRAVGVFLWESSALLSPINSATLFLLTLVIRFRLDVPIVPVVSKVDLLSDYEKATYYDSLMKIKDKLAEEAGVLAEFISSMHTVLREYSIPARVIGVSGKNKEGLDELYGFLKEVFCVCGDLT